MFITPRVGTRYSVQDKIVSGADLIIDKNIRGIFPPLADNTTLLIGTWVIDVKESKTHGSSIVTYSLEFKKNGALSILKTKCNGDIPMKWKSYFNNLVLTEINHGLDTSMIISNLPEDEACIRGSDGFVDQLLDASIWTVYDKKLFLLIERKHKQEEIN